MNTLAAAFCAADGTISGAKSAIPSPILTNSNFFYENLSPKMTIKPLFSEKNFYSYMDVCISTYLDIINYLLFVDRYFLLSSFLILNKNFP